MIQLRRVNKRILLIKMAIGKWIINTGIAYAPQVGREGVMNHDEKDRF